MCIRDRNIGETEWVLGFQSRVGPKQWLQPYTENVVEQMANDGIKEVDVICPGFSVDCLETLEEVDLMYKNQFIEAGGSSFRYIPCLNDRPTHIDMLYEIVSESASDWLPHSAQRSSPATS